VDTAQQGDSVNATQATVQTQEQKDVQDSVNKLLASAKELIDSNIRQTDAILGLGWNFNDSAMSAGCNCTGFLADVRNRICKTRHEAAFIRQHTSARDWLGFVITALAISLGAPFWFDLLNKFVRLRGSGDDPEKKRKGAEGTNPPAAGNG
jgi:hypothetical protein